MFHGIRVAIGGRLQVNEISVWGFRLPHVDVHVAKFPAGFLEFKGVALLVDY